MNWQDLVNAGFELFGCVAISLSILYSTGNLIKVWIVVTAAASKPNLQSPSQKHHKLLYDKKVADVKHSTIPHDAK